MRTEARKGSGARVARSPSRVAMQWNKGQLAPWVLLSLRTMNKLGIVYLNKK